MLVMVVLEYDGAYKSVKLLSNKVNEQLNIHNRHFL